MFTINSCGKTKYGKEVGVCTKGRWIQHSKLKIAKSYIMTRDMKMKG